MLLKLLDAAGNVVRSMEDNEAQLGSYGPQDFYTVHIIDMDPSTVGIDDLDEVEKYQISEEDYNLRDDTFRKFKEEKMKNDPDNFKHAKQELAENYMQDLAADITVGDRCCVAELKRGTVRFVGTVQNAQPGYFVGVELDTPEGKNDGTFKENRYFQCQQGFGLFVRPNSVQVGNYPPLAEEDPDEI